MAENNQGVLKAVIKLDDPSTGSTGGVVVNTFIWYNEGILNEQEENLKNPLPYDVNDKTYIAINCPKDCKPGWIYTSKTNILVDSNKPPK
jgi:hypothetical protein